MGDTTATCEKCRSAIDAEAARCPECGFEPGNRGKLSGGIITLVCYPVFAISATIALISVLLPFSGAALSTAAFGVIFFGGVAAVSGGFLYSVYKKKDRTAADPSLSS
ncbi:hypothetical protein [Halorarum salinum]|uniref:Uncharacterized protein n=1 Tax=Halorarum salinum TaxID=2743089 RepID=A0A7D5LBU6_9EURY|nr:hypothetical protein [Halobaculum salinum]QLG62834.1 hypothetical protein HUG12_14295 [Halobaculum salinum]